MNDPPDDLCKAAIKAARRLQSLPDGQEHTIRLVKLGDRWVLVVVSSQKAEVATNN